MIGLTEFEKLPSILKDPFAKKYITKLLIWMDIDNNGSTKAYGWVEFKNGETSGRQDFRMTDINAVIIAMKQFINEFQS